MVKKTDESALVDAARALDEALARFSKLTSEAERVALTSHKNMRRASQALAEAAECENALSESVRALNGAIGVARESHQSHSEALRARAQAIEARKQIFDQLMARLEALGNQAAAVNDFAKTLLGQSLNQERPEITKLSSELMTLAGEAHHIYEASHAAEFIDLTQQADALRSQLLSAQKKIAALEQLRPADAKIH